MKNPVPFKSRLKIVGIMLLVFICLYIVGRDPYLIGWLANNYFLFIWAPIVLLMLFNQTRCAWCITGGSFLGIAAGQGAENLKNTFFSTASDADSLYWGIPVWIAIVVLSVALGIYLEVRQNKKDKQPEAAENKDKKAE